MKPSVIAAFVVGAALASGIVYEAVKPKPEFVLAEAAPPAISVEQAKPEPEKPSPAPAIAPAIAPAAEITAPPVKPAISKTPLKVTTKLPQPLNRRRPVKDAVQAEVSAQQTANLAPAPPPAPELAPPPPAQETQEVKVLEQPPEPPPPGAGPTTVTLQSGVNLDVRIGETLSTRRNRPGDNFLATLTGPLVIDGWVIAERGARVEGRVVESDAGGRVKGTARLSVELVRITTADGQRIRIQTEPIDKKASASSGEDAAKIGGGAALGAIIGAIAGGGKGAGIGAGAGGAIGAGDVLLTRGKPAEIPVETRLSFRVINPVEISEKK